MRKIYVLLALAFVAASANAQATMSMCKDGSKSATSGRGACSGHGGVDAKATDAAMKASAKVTAKASTKTDTKSATAGVTCSDGTKSAGGQGACSGHGGVSKTADMATSASQRDPNMVVPAPATKSATTPQSTSAATAAAAPAKMEKPVAKPEAPTTSATKSEPKVVATTKTASGRGEDNDPAGALAKCKDGMYSHSSNRRGACSRHGGVANWM